MDCIFDKKKAFAEEWMYTCVESDEYTYVLNDELYDITTQYSDLIYKEICDNKELNTFIEKRLNNEKTTEVIESITKAKCILDNILFKEFDYVYQPDNDIWLKKIHTSDEYYHYITKLITDGVVGFTIDEINDNTLEMGMNFYPCGEFYPELIVSKSHFDNVIPLFPKYNKQIPYSKYHKWSDYNNITLSTPNGEKLSPNDKLEDIVRDILINYEIQKNMNL